MSDTIDLSELVDAAQKAFPADALTPARDESWALVAEMGWLMVRVPEDMGGLGLGRDASTALVAEMGRVLAAAPLLPALLGLEALLGADAMAGREDRIEAVMGGDYVPLALLAPRLEAGSDGALSGTVAGVLEADMASAVVAPLPGGLALVPVDAPGVALVERETWDRSRRVFDMVLDGYRADPALALASAAGSDVLADRLALETQVALAADCLGGAEAALAMTVDYLGMRRQFDRPIGMFQALKHRAADMKTRIVAAHALLEARLADPAATPAAAGALKALAAEAYEFVTEEAIQLHGGIGLTKEHPIHLFMTRAMLNLQLGGPGDLWTERMGRETLAAFA